MICSRSSVGLRSKDQQFKRVYGDLKKLLQDAGQYADWFAGARPVGRYSTRGAGALIRTELSMQPKFCGYRGLGGAHDFLFAFSRRGHEHVQWRSCGCAPVVTANPEMEAAMMRRYAEPGGRPRMRGRRG